MLEVKENIKFIIKHPDGVHQIDINFYSRKEAEPWLPYLYKFEEYLKTNGDGSVMGAPLSVKQ